MTTVFDRMTPDQRLIAVNVDFTHHKEFAKLSGVACVGTNIFSDEIPTAGTNGRDVIYNPNFVMTLSRKQLRFVVAHETLHKALRHCSEYVEICQREPEASNIAMDYVVNAMIHEADPNLEFIEWTTDPVPLLHPKYYGMSFVQVLKDLLKNAKPIPKPQGAGANNADDDATGDGASIGRVFVDPDGKPIGAQLDKHEIGKLKGKDKDTNDRQVSDANHQGSILAQKIAGRGTSNGALDNTLVKRDTNWREYVKEWLASVCEGDEYSKYSPPNKRMLPLGFIMPSHFSETTGEIVIACDTSGSMGGLYPTVFGEIARICQTLAPESVRVLWWEYEVVGEQIFKPIDYHKIGSLMKPVGGGGTYVTCVADYIEANKIKPKGIIYLTDGYIESDYRLPDFPVLFGAVDNDSFVASRGKTVRIYS